MVLYSRPKLQNQTHHHHHDHHTINIDTNHTIDHHQLATIQEKINTPPKILSTAAGRACCSIFKVPQCFNEAVDTLLQPKIISIGPLHHGLPHVEMMEEHKYHYLGQLLERTNMRLEDLLKAVSPLMGAARECYSEVIMLEDQHFIEMLVVDGCFIIELFRKVSKLVLFQNDDPIASMSWIFPALLRDLHMLENQIPFFVLQCLYDLTYGGANYNKVNDDNNGGSGDSKDGSEGITLATLSLDFFDYAIQRPFGTIWNFKDLKPKHLLDLLRSSFIIPELELKVPSPKQYSAPSHVIHSISKLQQAGIHLRPGNSETFLAVIFRRGVIEMPRLTIDEFMSSMLANCVAYEQCHNGLSTYFTTYAMFLDCLVNSSRDVEYLCDKNIIENCFGTEAEIATFINNLGKKVAFDLDECYLAELFEAVNIYHHTTWHFYWAKFKYTYFNKPWTFISMVVALLLFGLTVLHTLYTVMPYYKPSG